MLWWENNKPLNYIRTFSKPKKHLNLQLSIKKYLIWDWNGTLLDDAHTCVSCMNKLLEARNLPLLDLDSYREIFAFPVKDYYEKAGFDFSDEPFEKPAMEFIDLYYKALPQASLFPSVKDTLAHFTALGFSQSILSAMEHGSLVESLKAKGIATYFDIISGINDHYAHSKEEIGFEMLRKIGAEKDRILIIGDTLHDLEVGEALGVDVLLVANGHQSIGRLQKRSENVLESLDEVMTLFDKNPGQIGFAPPTGNQKQIPVAWIVRV